MSTALEADCHRIITNIRPDAIPAFAAVLDRSGALDEIKERVYREAVAETRADIERAPNLHARADGKLGEAVALIEAGEAKDAVLAAVSRRTYFRALRECQECQVTPSHRSRSVGGEKP